MCDSGGHSVRHTIISFGRRRSSGPMPNAYGCAFKRASFHLGEGVAGLDPKCSDALLAWARGNPTEVVGTVISSGLEPKEPVAVHEKWDCSNKSEAEAHLTLASRKLSGGGDFMTVADKQTWLFIKTDWWSGRNSSLSEWVRSCQAVWRGCAPSAPSQPSHFPAPSKSDGKYVAAHSIKVGKSVVQILPSE